LNVTVGLSPVNTRARLLPKENAWLPSALRLSHQDYEEGRQEYHGQHGGCDGHDVHPQARRLDDDPDLVRLIAEGALRHAQVAQSLDYAAVLFLARPDLWCRQPARP